MTAASRAWARVPPTVILREIEGESVILNLESERYFGLDTVGTDMWRAVTTAADQDAAIEMMSTLYPDVTAATLRQDMTQLLAELEEHGLIELAGAA